MHREAVNHLRRADPILARVIDRVGSCRFAPRAEGTHFDAVMRSIIYQQLSGGAAFTIYGRVLALFGGAPPRPAELLATPDERLREAGLSRQKIAYLKDLAQRAESADVPIDGLHDLPDAEIMSALTRVKGVGQWTAQMFLMFRLGRQDVLPELDLGIRKAIQRAYGLRALPSAERVRKLGASWSPYSSIACWYLWRSLDVKDDARAATTTRRKSARPARKNARAKRSVASKKRASRSRAQKTPASKAARKARR
jgi:DNA-3-methyladenine glycosylase II